MKTKKLIFPDNFFKCFLNENEKSTFSDHFFKGKRNENEESIFLDNFHDLRDLQNFMSLLIQEQLCYSSYEKNKQKLTLNETEIDEIFWFELYFNMIFIFKVFKQLMFKRNI